MKFLISTTILATLMAFALGCQTQFTGSPKVPNGADGCRSTCEARGMVMAGMVFMGEYSDGCICAVPGKEQAVLEAVAGAGPAAVGVIMQMRKNARQQSQGR